MDIPSTTGSINRNLKYVGLMLTLKYTREREQGAHRP